ncbi:solute carrier family 2 member 9, like 1 [Gouania willdenowi]|uniref:solute carrier family 2 member 9, like 1 n=1 Tax=Gouania willdenowi TaxID=441366 RepID=UPI0010565070|nr:solute carrier family 2, facilitated glucose transporter member 9-like [Gouania willdenowi]
METWLHQLTRGNALVLIIVLGVGGSFQSGYQMTALSSPSPFIQRFINSSWYDRYEETPSPRTVTTIWSLIVSLLAVGAICGAFSVKFVSNILGRKKGVIFNSLINIVAGILMLISKTAKSFEMIIVARILVGFTAGLGLPFHLMYLVEISPKKIRGRVAITSANFLSLGKLIGQLLGLSELLGREELWHFALFFPVCFSVLQIVVLPFLPESPRYLFIEKGDKEEGKKALQNLWGPGDYKQEIDEMLTEQEAIEAVPPKSPLMLLRDRAVRWPLITMCLIYSFNQLSGTNAVSTFSFDIFKETGIPEDKIRYVILGLGLCEIITSMCASLLIERVGRRPFFWGGYGLMFSLWVLITITLNLKESVHWFSFITAFLIIFVIVCFSGGPGAAIGTLNTELFIQSDRAPAFAITGIFRWMAYGVVGFAFPFVISSFGSYSFVLFACVCLLGCLYTFFILPETKGKTLLEIMEEFKTITVCGKSSKQEIHVETKL